MSKYASTDPEFFRPLVFSGLSFNFITDAILDFFNGNRDSQRQIDEKSISQLLKELTRETAAPLTEKVKSVIEKKKESKELTELVPKRTDKESVSTYESNKTSLDQERLNDGTYKFTPKGEFSGVVQVQRIDPASGKLLQDYDTLVYDKGKVSFVMPGLNGQSRVSGFSKMFKEAEVSVQVPVQEKQQRENIIAPAPQGPVMQNPQVQQVEPSIGEPIPTPKRDIPAPAAAIKTEKTISPVKQPPKPLETKKTLSLQDRIFSMLDLGKEIQAGLKKHAELARQRNSEKPPAPLRSDTPKPDSRAAVESPVAEQVGPLSQRSDQGPQASQPRVEEADSVQSRSGQGSSAHPTPLDQDLKAAIDKRMAELGKSMTMYETMIRISDRHNKEGELNHWKNNKKEAEAEIELLKAKLAGASDVELENKALNLNEAASRSNQSYQELSALRPKKTPEEMAAIVKEIEASQKRRLETRPGEVRASAKALPDQRHKRTPEEMDARLRQIEANQKRRLEARQSDIRGPSPTPRVGQRHTKKGI